MSYLTVPAAAAYLTVSTRTLRRLLASGVLPYARVSARRIAVPQEALDHYARSQWQSGRTVVAGPSSSSSAALEFIDASLRWQRGRTRSR